MVTNYPGTGGGGGGGGFLWDQKLPPRYKKVTDFRQYF